MPLRVPLLASLLLLSASLPAGAQGGKQHHPRLHHALHELREARVELRAAKHDFGGHRKKALEAVNAAMQQIELGLRAVGDPFTGVKVDMERYRGYKHHPHLHHALHELREARQELQKAKHDFGGHRKAALRDTQHAIEQIELALRHVP